MDKESWQDLVKTYFDNKSLEEFKNQFPTINSKIDCYKTLFLLFKHVKSYLEGNINKCNIDTYLPLIFDNFPDIFKEHEYDLAYIDLFRGKDLNFIHSSFFFFLTA